MSRVKLHADNYCHKPLENGKDVEDLITAAAKGGVDGLRQKLGDRNIEDVRAGPGVTVLHALARSRSGTSPDQKALRAILLHGMDLDVVNDRGETALYRAAFTKSLWMIQPLVQAGADLDVKKDGLDAFGILKERWGNVKNEPDYFQALNFLEAAKLYKQMEAQTPEVSSTHGARGFRL